MDPLAHTLLGAGLGNALFRERYGKAAAPVLILASNLPDIDAIVMLTGDPAAVMLRRTFGHSLFLVPVWSFLLTLALRRFVPRISLGALFGMSLLGAGLHLVFDLVNSFGVLLLWPFSDWRPEWAILFIVDLALTGLLAAPLLLGLIPRLRSRLVLWSRLALLGVALYILFCGANRLLAERALRPEAKGADFAYVFPEPFGPCRWRGVVRRGSVYSLFLVQSLLGRIEPRGELQTALDDPRVAQARATPLGRRLERFFKAPVWSAGPDAVKVEDLRFRPLILDRSAVFVFRFRVDPEGKVAPVP